MNKALFYLALLSILLNVYVNSAWIYAYVNTETHADALLKFWDYVPSLLSTSLLFGISVGSIFIFAKFRASATSTLYNGCIIIQVAFMLLYLWQLL